MLEIYKLFSCVEKKDSPLEVDMQNGIIFLNGTSWAKDLVIKEMMTQGKLDKTFHKTWSKVQNASRLELLMEQIKHYASTYGTNFESDAYIPSEEIGVPKNTKMLVIKPLTKDEILSKSEDMIKSGMALAEDTLNDLISVLDYLNCDYQAICNESKNKEFNTRMIVRGNYVPKNPEEVLRAAVFNATNSTLLIKNENVIETIKASDLNPSGMFERTGLHVMAQIFNRYKPIFLAFKSTCPSVINKIAKHSKKCHKPMKENSLNLVTNKLLSTKDNVLKTANIFTLFRAYNSVCMYLGGKKAVAYKIRNGKVWVEKKNVKHDQHVLASNFKVLLDTIKDRITIADKKVFIPEGITYTLPTSEKKMFGGIPYGSSVEGQNLAVGIYWENSWGATDLDLSGVSLNSKIGWDSSYDDNGLIYSGDMTDAPKGATEFLHCKDGTFEPTLIMNNVYSGDENTKYRIVVGSGNDIDCDYMMSTDNLVFYADTVSQDHSTYLGLMTKEGENCKFVITNMAVGSARVSGDDEKSEAARIAMLEELERLPTLNELLKDSLVQDIKDADIDLSPSEIQKDTLMSLFL